MCLTLDSEQQIYQHPIFQPLIVFIHEIQDREEIAEN